jgi:hypothetical protein
MAAYKTVLRAPALLRREGRRPRPAVVGGVPDPLWYEPLHRMGLADPVTIHGRVAEAVAMSSVGWARNLQDALDFWRACIGSEAKEN